MALEHSPDGTLTLWSSPSLSPEALAEFEKRSTRTWLTAGLSAAALAALASLTLGFKLDCRAELGGCAVVHALDREVLQPTALGPATVHSHQDSETERDSFTVRVEGLPDPDLLTTYSRDAADDVAARFNAFQAGKAPSFSASRQPHGTLLLALLAPLLLALAVNLSRRQDAGLPPFRSVKARLTGRGVHFRPMPRFYAPGEDDAEGPTRLPLAEVASFSTQPCSADGRSRLRVTSTGGTTHDIHEGPTADMAAAADALNARLYELRSLP